MKKRQRLSLPIPCTVETSDLKKIRAGLAPLLPNGVHIELAANDGEGVQPGGLVQLTLDDPIGLLRATARIVSVDRVEERHGQNVLTAALTFLDQSDVQQQAIRARLMTAQPLVLALGLGGNGVHTCTGDFRLIEAASEADFLRLFRDENVVVLVLGPQLRPSESLVILAKCASQTPNVRTANIVLGVGTEAESFQDFIGQDQIFYLCRGTPSPAELRMLVIGAVDQYRSNSETHDSRGVPVAGTDEMLDFCIRLGTQESIASAASLLIEAVETLVSVDRADYLIYDSAKEILWSKRDLDNDARNESVASGLVGYVVRTGQKIRLDRMTSDPRYDPESDNPIKHHDGSFIAEPILGCSGEVIGVLTAARPGFSRPFTSDEVRTIEMLVSYAGIVMGVLRLQSETQLVLQERSQSIRNSELYRKEALDNCSRSPDEEGSLLKISSQWSSRANWIMVLFSLVAIAFIALARVDEFADGPAIIRARNKIEISATRPGIVRSVEVNVGTHVKAKDPLVRLYDVFGVSTSEHMNDEMLALGDGIVSDVRVRPGQQVSPGEHLISIIDESAGYDVIVLLPGHYAPQIHPGMTLVLKLDGYPGSHEIMRVDKVGADIVGPQEAMRYAGKESAAAITMTGPIVIASAHLWPERYFVDGHVYGYRDGMIGQAGISVRSNSMILSLIPGLKEIFVR